MAHYGGAATPPRVHRPRAPVMSASPPLTAPLAPLRPQPPVSLSAPRPENERTTNEYVETPFRSPNQTGLLLSTTQQQQEQQLQQQQQQQHQQPPTPPPQPPRAQRPTRLPPAAPPVTKQPTTASFNKETTATTPSMAIGFVNAINGVGVECASRPSIMCPECNRCRCESCQQPRPLPERWVCNNGCLLSADTIVDYASCLCCVKGLFYHCSDSDGGESCADEPCGCGPDRRKARWGCLGALSIALPCLLLYWPLRGCKHVVEVCYARHSRTGCRCRPPLATPEKRLLDSGPDF